MCRGIGQRIDDLQLFGDRTGPSVRNDERQRIFVFGADVNEMNVQSIDLSEEVRQGLQFCLALAPVVIGRPITRQRLHRRKLHALRSIRNGFPFRPLCRFDAPTQFGEFLFWKIHFLKRTNSICLLAASLCTSGLGHGVLLWNSFGFFHL